MINEILGIAIIIGGIVLCCDVLISGGSASEINTGFISIIMGYLIMCHNKLRK